LIDKGREIQGEVVYARYPLKMGDKWVTPMGYYTAEKARTIINNTKFVINGVKEYLKKGKQRCTV